MKFGLLLALIFSYSAVAAAPKTLSQKLEDKKYYYSALNEFFRESYTREIFTKDVTRLENLLFYTGIELLEDYEPSLLERYPSSSTRFILGRQAMQAKDTTRAIDLFSKVHPSHRFYPEAKLLESQIQSQQGDQKRQDKAIGQCLRSALSHEKSSKGEKIQRYYRMVYEVCLVNKARQLFKSGEFQKSIEAYNRIPKKSYKWPYILLEKAWVYYQMGDFNRTLGILITYKSPLMDTYFFPEAEYLTALAYFRLCLYQDSLVVINQYYQAYRPRFLALENVLRKNKNSQTYFYNLMFRPGEDLKKHEDFVRHIITRLKKQTRFSLDFNSIYKIKREVKRIKTNEKKEIQQKLLGHLAEVQSNMVSKINYNAKSDVFQFLQTVPFFSSELFKMNLEIISRKKDLVYKNRKLVTDRNRGDYSNVKQSRFEHFWKFQGEFWADELGDYSLGLQSNCQTTKKASLTDPNDATPAQAESSEEKK
ncbi:MAG TPA: hypothetical protein VNJ01_04715 [Bacteriovoracaceae bacterium]|nr:hypothetical protein [Bacteriovoracaceae bacterium]